MSPSDLASLLDVDVAAIDVSDPKVSPPEWDDKNPHYHYRRGRRGALADAAQAIREHLVPKWTKTAPTAPGIYWRRFYGGRPELTQVELDPERSPPDHLWAAPLIPSDHEDPDEVTWPGPVVEACNAEWSGPIDTP